MPWDNYACKPQMLPPTPRAGAPQVSHCNEKAMHRKEGPGSPVLAAARAFICGNKQLFLGRLFDPVGNSRPCA